MSLLKRVLKHENRETAMLKVSFGALLVVCLWCAIYGATLLGNWETSHGYPYGKMCYSIFTGNINTCR
jgi:hypothetical protein